MEKKSKRAGRQACCGKRTSSAPSWTMAGVGSSSRSRRHGPPLRGTGRLADRGKNSRRSECPARLSPPRTAPRHQRPRGPQGRALLADADHAEQPGESPFAKLTSVLFQAPIDVRSQSQYSRGRKKRERRNDPSGSPSSKYTGLSILTAVADEPRLKRAYRTRSTLRTTTRNTGYIFLKL